MSRLHELSGKGQSIWLDDLRHSLLTTGELKRMLEEDAVTGVTSNPTIFANAISHSSDYDERVHDLVGAGAGVQELYETLVTEDIQAACDLFGETWRRSEGRDGFASIEVSPEIAYDRAKTVSEVRDWVKRVDRDNLFVKVPATPEGVGAIERLTAEGISINVTLIFSLERYRDIAQAYISGLETFVQQGGDPSGVQSVASFFVSRVDVEIDRRLGELADSASGRLADHLRSMKGRAGIANARAAYGIFTELFSGARWSQLEARGARVQRPLWASTGVKDPAYRDTMYVEELIAPDSINTMPDATIRAFQDRGEPDVGPFDETEIEEARRFLDELSDAGIDYHEVTDGVLMREGVEKFSQSFEELMTCLDKKRAGHM